MGLSNCGKWRKKIGIWQEVLFIPVICCLLLDIHIDEFSRIQQAFSYLLCVCRLPLTRHSVVSLACWRRITLCSSYTTNDSVGVVSKYRIRLVNRLAQWSEKWQMLFNQSKCKCLHIRRANGKDPYEMHNTVLLKTSKEKDLGENKCRLESVRTM